MRTTNYELLSSHVNKLYILTSSWSVHGGDYHHIHGFISCKFCSCSSLLLSRESRYYSLNLEEEVAWTRVAPKDLFLRLDCFDLLSLDDDVASSDVASCSATPLSTQVDLELLLCVEAHERSSYGNKH